MPIAIEKTQNWWLSLDSDQRLVAARQVIETRDPEWLWILTSAHLTKRQGDARQIGAHTEHTYRMGIRKFLQFVSEKSAGLDALPHMQVYADWLVASGQSPMTTRTRVTAAQHLVRALAWAGIENELALQKVKFPRHQGQQKARRAYTNDEVARLLRNADVETRVIVLLGVEGAFKPAEMLNLRLEEVMHDLSQGTNLCLYREEDGSRVAVDSVLVSPPLRQALEQWAAVLVKMQQKPTDRFLLSVHADYIEDKLRHLCQRAGVPYEGAGVEGLRITAGARYYQKYGDKAGLKDFLRMTSSKGLEKYVQAVNQLI